MGNKRAEIRIRPCKTKALIAIILIVLMSPLSISAETTAEKNLRIKRSQLSLKRADVEKRTQFAAPTTFDGKAIVESILYLADVMLYVSDRENRGQMDKNE